MFKIDSDRLPVLLGSKIEKCTQSDHSSDRITARLWSTNIDQPSYFQSANIHTTSPIRKPLSQLTNSYLEKTPIVENPIKLYQPVVPKTNASTLLTFTDEYMLRSKIDLEDRLNRMIKERTAAKSSRQEVSLEKARAERSVRRSLILANGAPNLELLQNRPDVEEDKKISYLTSISTQKLQQPQIIETKPCEESSSIGRRLFEYHTDDRSDNKSALKMPEETCFEEARFGLSVAEENQPPTPSNRSSSRIRSLVNSRATRNNQKPSILTAWQEET